MNIPTPREAMQYAVNYAEVDDAEMATVWLGIARELRIERATRPLPLKSSTSAAPTVVTDDTVMLKRSDLDMTEQFQVGQVLNCAHCPYPVRLDDGRWVHVATGQRVCPVNAAGEEDHVHAHRFAEPKA
jgi:hypothetical protein